MTESSIEGARREAEHRYGILVVDDEEAIVESIEMTLEDDYRVFTALSGSEGLALLDREDIALVIVDQVMPEMTGVEFLEQVVARKPATVRMMLTGYADIGALVHAINDGRIYRYIQKPWEPEDLRIDVKRALEAFAPTSENVHLASALGQGDEQA